MRNPGNGPQQGMLALVAAILVTAGGCRSEAEKFAVVSGTVMAGGKPVTGAVITFEPIDDTPGPKASAAVIDGRFQVDKEAKLQGGRYQIRISMLPSEILQTLRASVPDAFPPAGSTIAPEYDSQSKLQRLITTDSKNEFDFEVDLL